MEGKRVSIVGEIVEHLKLNKKEWFTLRLQDGSLLTINAKFCSEIKEDHANANGPSKEKNS